MASVVDRHFLAHACQRQEPDHHFLQVSSITVARFTPSVLECLTYRWFGHHVGDPGTSYRPKEEVAKWKAQDPIHKLREQAIASRSAEAKDFDAIDADVRRVIDEAAAFALASAQPSVETALDHVFSN